MPLFIGALLISALLLAWASHVEFKNCNWKDGVVLFLIGTEALVAAAIL